MTMPDATEPLPATPMAPAVADMLRHLAAIAAMPPLLIGEDQAPALAMRDPSKRVAIDEVLRHKSLRAVNGRETGGYGYVIDDNNVAMLNVTGVITPMMYAWGDGGETISEWLEADVVAATADTSVRAAMLVDNSPGGYVAGCYEICDAFAALTAAKPTATFVPSQCTSAAYALASQTGRITAYKTALVGSIGTRSMLVDASRMLSNAGIVIHPIDSGGMKSAGLFGTPITDEQKQYFRATTLALNGFFQTAVQDGREFDDAQLAAVSDAKVHVAGDALKLGLIDAVGTLDDAYAALIAELDKLATPTQKGRAAAKPAGSKQTTDSDPAARAEEPTPEPPATPPAPNKETAMADPVTPPAQANEPKPATIPELQKQFATDPAFALEAAGKAWTMQEAKSEYCDRLQAKQQTDATAAAAEAARVKAETPPAGGRGTPPVASGRPPRQQEQQESGDAVADYNAAVEMQMAKPGMHGNRKKAVAAVNKRDPELHRAYLEANNKSRKSRDMIADKFDGRA